MGAFSQGFQAGTQLGLAIKDRREKARKQSVIESLKEQEQIRLRTNADIDNAAKAINSSVKLLSAKIPGINSRKVEVYNKVARPALSKLSGVELPEISEWTDTTQDTVSQIAALQKQDIPASEIILGTNEIIARANLDPEGFAERQQEFLSGFTPAQQREEQLTPNEQRGAALRDAGILLTAKEELDTALAQSKFDVDKEKFKQEADKQALGMFGTSLNKLVSSSTPESQKAFFESVKDKGGDLSLLDNEKDIKGLKGLPAETAGKFALSITALERLEKDLLGELFTKDGRVNKQALVEARLGSTPRGQKLNAALNLVVGALLRPVTGAVINVEEDATERASFSPSILFGDADSAKTKLLSARNRIRDFILSVDPQQEHLQNLLNARQGGSPLLDQLVGGSPGGEEQVVDTDKASRGRKALDILIDTRRGGR